MESKTKRTFDSYHYSPTEEVRYEAMNTGKSLAELPAKKREDVSP